MILDAVLLLALTSQPGTANAKGAPASTAPEPVRLELWLNPTDVAPADSIRVWILVVNTGGEPARISAVTMDTHGIRQVGVCWSNAGPACNDRGDRVETFVVPAHSSFRLHADAVANDIDGALVPSAGLTWTAGSLSGSAAAKAPPLTIDAGPSKRTEFLTTVATDLAWPVAVFGLGYLLKQHQQRKREETRQQQETAKVEREEHRQQLTEARERLRTEQSEARRKRAELLATWNQMLTRSHDNAERHYLPFASAIMSFQSAEHTLRRARRLARRNSVPLDASLVDDCLFRLLLTVRVMAELRNSIGGFYFKDRGGEGLAAFAWGTFVDYGLNWHLDQTLRMTLAGRIVKTTTSAEFKALRASDAAVDRDFRLLLPQFDSWHEKTFPFGASVLDICLQVVIYETNRPYELWYGTCDSMPAPALRLALKRVDRTLAKRSGPIATAAMFERKGERDDRVRDGGELTRRAEAYLAADPARRA